MNLAKYISYKEAWARIKDANRKGFHFEVVTICESIISDRLQSYVLGVTIGTSSNEHYTFKKLISKWRSLENGKVPYKKSADLSMEVDEWRKARNEVVHGLVKSKPGQATENVESFLLKAEKTAQAGMVLARQVSDWHNNRLKNVKNSHKRASE